uniref:Uncharacterized protein n=1 Tax=Ditylenchus dipsaci TaxID=166011 RepID=A0A915DZU0_9BILA
MLVKWKMLEPFERASNHMYEYASSLSIQLPIAKMLARDLDQMIEGQLQPIVEKMRMLLREKFFYLGFTASPSFAMLDSEIVLRTTKLTSRDK